MFGQREQRPDGSGGSAPNPNDGIGANIGSVRQRGEELLSAADDAIEQGLSKESQKFVTNVRQHSGQ